MRKLLLLCATMLGVVGAWAEEADNFVAPEAGKYYIIKGDHATHHWLTGVVEGGGIDVSDNREDAGVYYYDGTSLRLAGAETSTYIGKNGSQISLVSTATTVTLTSHGNAGKYRITVGGSNLYNNQSDYTREAGNTTADPGNNRFTWGFIEKKAYTIDNFNAAYTTWTNYAGNEFTSGWGYRVVHNATNITIHRIGNTNDLGWSTKNDIRYPYLVRNKSYLLTVPDNIYITDYQIETTNEGSYNGDVSYTLTNNEITIALTNGDAGNNTAGVTIRKITLFYIEREECNYILTDNAANQYQGTFYAVLGVEEPTLTGSPYELSNEQWNEGTFTANITFPFPVSSETVSNPTMISSYNYSNMAAGNFKWYADDNKIKVEKEVDKIAAGRGVTYSNVAEHLWTIYPKFNNGSFTFQIKNVATGLFVNSTSDSSEHNDASHVTLSSEASNFTIGQRNNEGVEFINSRDKCLSVNSSGPATNFIQTVGTHTSHYGTAITFHDYVDNTTWPEFVSTGTTINPLVIAIDSDAKKSLVAQKIPSSTERYVRITGSDEEPELGYGQWIIYPALSGNKIGFNIKNIATDTYIYAKPNGVNEDYPVVLNGEGTIFDFTNSMFAYTDGANTLYLSVPANDSYDLPLGVSTEADDTRKTIDFPEFRNYQVTIGEVGYTTLYSPFTVIAPEEGKEVEIYAITDATTSENNKVTLTKLETLPVIPANQGCILKGSGKITFSKTDDDWVEGNWSTNLLRGSFTNTYVQGDAYVLSAPNGVESVGLYKALLNKDANGEAGTSHFKNNAGKAYLPATAVASDARFLVFDFGDDMETGITETENGNVNAENDEVYDLAGRRVQNAQKGIFIVNGKKVVR